MFGAIVADYLGAACEQAGAGTPDDWQVPRSVCRFTGATVLTVATAEALLDGVPVHARYAHWYQRFPAAGYPRGFRAWMNDPSREHLDTGVAQRASPIGWGSPRPEEVQRRAQEICGGSDRDVSEAVIVGGAVAIAREGRALDRSSAEVLTAVAQYAQSRHSDPLLDLEPGSRPSNDAHAPASIVAIAAVQGATGFGEAMSQALALRRGTEQVVSIAGAVAEAAFGGVPEPLAALVWRELPGELQAVVMRFWRGE